MSETLPPPARLLDLGTPNELGQAMQQIGYTVQNTEGDLDDVPEVAAVEGIEAVTAFESNLIQDALKTTRGNRAKAARYLSDRNPNDNVVRVVPAE